MSKWLEAADRFEERRNSEEYFEVQSALGAIEKIQNLLNSSFRQLIFLIGEPGSGKSFLLNHLNTIWADKRDIILIETPFLTPIDLLKKLLNHKGVSVEGNDMEQLRMEATQLYGNSDHLIMIDEAQLLSTEMREFIRILSDSKAFWFIIAMHRSEGEAILRAPHFKSRPHRVIELSPLSIIEGKNYIHSELMKMGFSEIIDEINPKLIAKAHRLSEGNFRNFKKIFYHLFHLLHYTNTHNKSKYLRPSSCTITMAAMNAELLHD
ncbi:MAG: ATP-binding protein [Sulfuricurvum sp.]|uniref:ATP-binding protein n=1 Tax=Sulfuricurvum sp. TaxID=2025608 RepID=UPI0026106F07|nr:ATP-binding protein [Sulfuricurvum sp.]MDD2949678.1 ATP-binding protein [Sulfuricurvum sp.]MDD5116965.1 ATP-binding protein [Sulfuricurvum sp.]